MENIIFNNDGSWMTREFAEATEIITIKMNKSLLFMNWDIHDKRQNSRKDNRKWAYIYIGNTRIPAFVDNVTGRAYKHDNNYASTWMEIPRFKFDRWMTTFDI